MKIHKRKIALAILLILIANGFLINFIVELIIFVIAYIYHSFNLEAYIVLESMFKTVITVIYPYILKE